jgi:hypothetical protein
MPYLCYIHRTTGGVPHFEVLPDSSPRDARERAAHLMAERPDALRAEIWDGEILVSTVPHPVGEVSPFMRDQTRISK